MGVYFHVDRDLDIWKHLSHLFIPKKGLWNLQENQKRPSDYMWVVSAWVPNVQRTLDKPDIPHLGLSITSCVSLITGGAINNQAQEKR